MKVIPTAEVYPCIMGTVAIRDGPPEILFVVVIFVVPLKVARLNALLKPLAIWCLYHQTSWSWRTTQFACNYLNFGSSKDAFNAWSPIVVSVIIFHVMATCARTPGELAIGEWAARNRFWDSVQPIRPSHCNFNGKICMRVVVHVE